jgi:predicted nucleic acid-binding protein
MQKTIISDTSCLILLNKIGELDILSKLFGEVIITSEIAKEYKQTLPSWIKIMNPKNINYQNILLATVDIGEASGIALAIESEDCLLILDDLKARRLASELGLHITGTIGVLIDAKHSGIIPAIKPMIDKIKGTNFHLTHELLKKISEATDEKL